MLPQYGNDIITQEVSASAPGYVFVVRKGNQGYIPGIPRTNLTMPPRDTFIIKKSDTTKKIIRAAGITAAALALMFGIKKLGNKIITKIKKPPKTP